MDPGPFFTSEYTIYYKHCTLHFLQENIIFHTIRLILCFQQASEINNLIVSLGQSNLVVLCVGSTSTGAVDTFRRDLISYWFDKLGFILRETCCYTHHTLLLGSSNERVCHVLSIASSQDLNMIAQSGETTI